MSFRRCDVVPEQCIHSSIFHPLYQAIVTMPIERLCLFCRRRAGYQQRHTQLRRSFLHSLNPPSSSTIVCAFNGAVFRVSSCAPPASKDSPTHLGETDVGGLLAEALTADVQAVLADETSLVRADTASEAVSILFPLRAYPCDSIFLLSTYHSRAPFPYVRGRLYQL